MTTKYKLKYTLSVDCNNGEGFDKATIMNENEKNPEIGACDSLIFISIVKPEDGSFSMDWFSWDVKDNEPCPISNLDLFKVWSLLARQVSERAPFSWQKKIAADAFATVQKLIAVVKE